VTTPEEQLLHAIFGEQPESTHDDQCEAEYIFPPGGWLPCGCDDRATSSNMRQETSDG
jgi:hypothetical protein